MKNYDVAIIGCGFIGSSLAKYLCKNYSIVTFDINPQPNWLNRFNIPHKICDIRNYEQLSKRINNPSVIIHTAIIQIPEINEQKDLAYEVNVLGTQNACEITKNNLNTKGMILIGSWHVFGERDLHGVIKEEFGYRPDKVEERARLYVISKILQEGIVRFYDERSREKIYGVLRTGTVLGDKMPDDTAAGIFINKALKGDEITPFKHSMFRPMIYVDIEDVCKGIESYINLIINNPFEKADSSFHVVNLAYPKPITIWELANIVRDSVTKYSKGEIQPLIKIVDKGMPEIYTPEDKNMIRFDIKKAKTLLGIKELISPEETIDKIIKKRMSNVKSVIHDKN